MQALFTKSVFTMQAGEVSRLRVARAQRLQVEAASGTDLWITVDGKGGDVWLRAGGELALAAGDQLMLSVQPKAEGPVRLALVESVRARDSLLASVVSAARRRFTGRRDPALPANECA